MFEVINMSIDTNSKSKTAKKNYKSIQNQRLSEVIDYLLMRDNKSQAELRGEINKYFGYEFIKDDTAMSKYKSTATIQNEIIEFFQEKYCINPEYIKGTSKIKFDMFKGMLNHFENIAIDWMSSCESEEELQTADCFLHITMDSVFYDFLVANSLSEILRKEKELATSQELINNINQLKKNDECIPKNYVLIPEHKWMELYETVKFYIPSSVKNHFSELNKYIFSKIEDSDDKNLH